MAEMSERNYIDRTISYNALLHRYAESESVRRQLAEALRPFAEAHRHRTAKGMRVGPGPALGPRQLTEASAALAANDALEETT